MHPYLTRLGVCSEVQEFFAPFYNTAANGDLEFEYGGKVETYGFAYHRVPVSGRIWLAGQQDFNLVKEVIISDSAMNAIAFLTFRYPSFMSLDHLLFVSIGTGLQEKHLECLRSGLAKKKQTLLFAGDFLGKVLDLKMAAGLQGMPVTVFEMDGICRVNFRQRNYHLPVDRFSLHALEKLSGIRFRIRTIKPKGFTSFFDQLKAAAFQY